MLDFIAKQAFTFNENFFPGYTLLHMMLHANNIEIKI